MHLICRYIGLILARCGLSDGALNHLQERLHADGVQTAHSKHSSWGTAEWVESRDNIMLYLELGHCRVCWDEVWYHEHFLELMNKEKISGINYLVGISLTSIMQVSTQTNWYIVFAPFYIPKWTFYTSIFSVHRTHRGQCRACHCSPCSSGPGTRCIEMRVSQQSRRATQPVIVLLEWWVALCRSRGIWFDRRALFLSSCTETSSLQMVVSGCVRHALYNQLDAIKSLVLKTMCLELLNLEFALSHTQKKITC